MQRRTVYLHVGVLAGLVLLSALVFWWHVWVGGNPATTVTCQCGDASQELWFLTWTPWAILHGHSPFFTNEMFAGQGGANMLANTSWIAASVVLAPITLAFGPIAAFNVGAVAGPALTGYVFFLAVRQVTGYVPGQVLGALLYGFSPFVVWNDPIGHLDFTLLFFPPLMFWLLVELVISHRHSARTIGVMWAVLVVVQFFVSTEMLAMSAIVGVVAILAGGAMAPGVVRDRWRRIVEAVAWAAGISVVVLAYPAWYAIYGPRHIRGTPWPNPAVMGGSPGAIWNAGRAVHSRGWFEMIGGYFGGAGPNFGPGRFPSLFFLGIPLVVFLALSAYLWGRSRIAWTVVVMGVVAWLFSLGSMAGTEFLPRAQQIHPWWLPWSWFGHLPVVGDIEPIRFVVLVDLAAGLLLAISLDQWRRELPALAGRFRAHLGGRMAALLIAVVGAAALAPVALTNSVPLVVRPSPLPRWFSAVGEHLDPATVVLVMPFAGQQAMGWQAQTRMHFRLAGGFSVVPGPTGASEFVVLPTGAVDVFDRLSPGTDAPPSGAFPHSRRAMAEVRAAIHRWRVSDLVVTPSTRNLPYVLEFLSQALGRPPLHQYGSWEWYRLR